MINPEQKFDTISQRTEVRSPRGDPIVEPNHQPTRSTVEATSPGGGIVNLPRRDSRLL